MNVPLFKQRRNTCGPTSLRMMLAYFGRDIQESEIIKSVGGIKKYGVRTVKLAKFVKELGFKTECLSYNRKLAVGKAKIKKPNIGDILKYLKQKIPVIICVRCSLFYNCIARPKDKGHFVVITGYKNNFFWYNDPYDGKRHKIKEGELVFAWFNNVLDSSAYLLAIWPR